MLNPPPSDSYSLVTTLVRFEERFAILRNEMLGEFRWPIANTPPDIKIGETVVLTVNTKKMEEEQKYERMRKLLEELIN